jgi:DNA polymerase I-like protein with 3'-5' exonuclease and polymerase domains
MVDNIIILDLETTINAPTPHFGASPTYPENRVVMLGYTDLEEYYCLTEPNDIKSFVTQLCEKQSLIVGHNIAFDVLYLMNYGLTSEVLLSDQIHLWDTMKFHYIQSGRLDTNPSLESVAKFWRLPFRKDTEIKERFRAGIGADQIDEHLLSSYLKSDVDITAKVFNKQKEHEDRCGEVFANYVHDLMQGIKVTTSMTHEGILFDTQGAKEQSERKAETLKNMEELVSERWQPMFPKELIFNPNSALQIETLLWGGTLSVPTREVVLDEDGSPVIYKSGQKKGEQKTRNTTEDRHIEGIVTQQSVELFDNRGWEKKSGAKTLEYILKYEPTGNDARHFVQDILGIRNLSKAISTYYRPYVSFVVEDTLHPSYNHCVTQTGRLSSNKPNMQNINGKKEQ